MNSRRANSPRAAGHDAAHQQGGPSSEFDTANSRERGGGLSEAAAAPSNPWLAWNYDMSAAPKNGDLLQLLVEHCDDGELDTATENEARWRTIGHNNFENDGEDKWVYAGWCWDHDHFTEGRGGRPIAWAPLLPLPADAPAEECKS